MAIKVLGEEFAYLNELIVKPIAEGKPFPRKKLEQITSRKGQKTFSQFIVGMSAAVAAQYNNSSVDIHWFREKVMDADETFEDIIEEHKESGLPIMYQDHSVGKRKIKIWKSTIQVHGLTTGRKEQGASTVKLGIKKGRTKYAIIIFEERSQITNEKRQAVMEGIRGYEHIITIDMSNPWTIFNDFISECHDVLPFDAEQLRQPPFRQWYDDGEKIIHYTNWRTNPYLKQWEIDNFVELEGRDPNRAKIASWGLPGIADGAIYADYMHKIHNLEELPDEHFAQKPTQCIGGVDWGYVNDTATASLWGTDSEYSWVAGYELWSHNNKKDAIHKSNMEMVQEVVEFYIGLKDKYGLRSKGRQGNFTVYVDNANITIAELLNSYAADKGVDDWLFFQGSYKPEIKKRIDYTTAAMALDKFFLNKTKMKELIKELEQSQWTEITSRKQQPERMDLNDHHINGMEYAIYNVIYHIHENYKGMLMDK